MKKAKFKTTLKIYNKLIKMILLMILNNLKKTTLLKNLKIQLKMIHLRISKNQMEIM